MNEQKHKFHVSIETGDYMELIRKIRDFSKELAEYASSSIDGIGEGEDIRVSVRINSISELRNILNVVDGCKYISGVQLFAIADSGGLKSEMSVGYFMHGKDRVYGDIYMVESARKSTQDKAIKAAIDILKSAQQTPNERTHDATTRD